jgi:hypothetical protein
MSQSSLLVGLLAFGFVLFVAARGRLPVYTGVLWGAKSSGTGGGTGDSASKAGSILNDLLGEAGKMLDSKGDGFDLSDAGRLGSTIAGELLPFPLDLPLEIGNKLLAQNDPNALTSI